MRKMEGVMMITLFIVVFVLSATLVHSQSQRGFINIDCGSSKNSYLDTDTGINYVFDGDTVSTGENANISLEYQYPKNPVLPFPLSDLRAFPIGNKNCYSLKPDGGAGTLNLIRATFLYGNYDEKDSPPEFDLYLDVNFWTAVRFRNSSEIFATEILATALSDTVHVCLVDKGLGVPFISALELRPVNKPDYATEEGVNATLVLLRRLDTGEVNGTGRYADDDYDRIWSRFSSNGWDSIRTSSDVNNYENGYKVPQEVIRTAARSKTLAQPLEIVWNVTDSKVGVYVFLHFAEIEKLERNQTRRFEVTWNGDRVFGSAVSPRLLYATTVSNSKALVGKDHRISLRATANSTLPPLLNGVEVFGLRLRNELLTDSNDTHSMTETKRVYRIIRNWAGDPCGPRNFSWEGLQCSHNSSVSPRILALNLSSSNLTGNIASSISRISLLRSLDLSNNKLDGPIPDFLSDLRSLTFLNLKGNQLSGLVPDSLRERANDGSLELSVDIENLCGSDPCKKKSNNVVTPVLASLACAIVVLLVLFVVWKVRRKRKSELAASNTGGHVAIKKSRFSYNEVLEITSNFKREIGKGGFGPVYHGSMKDGTEVAIKILSSSSSQGPKEFQTEAELLMRIHHRNLTSFVGYCDDGDKLALIYEYMPNGNLKEFLSEKSTQLSWEARLRIAVDAAQGLEYLHNGCKPGIVHRDVKTTNILLGEKFDAKIADFGLSKVFANENETHVETVVMGTAGYLDPEYYRSQKLNEKSDVFSFGVVLLELITGKPAIIKSEETIHVIQWVRAEIEEGNVRSVIDPRLQENFDEESVSKALDVALASTTSNSDQRATMEYVLSELKYCLDIELSKDSERSYDLGQKHIHSAHLVSNSTPELYLMYTDSMSADSMTNPVAR